MARQVFFAAVVMLAVGSPSSATVHRRLELRTPAALAIAIADGCPAPAMVLATARKEAARIWSGAGVSIDWMPVAELPSASPRSDWLVVRCVAGTSGLLPTSSTPILAIAGIRFIGSVPTNTIVVNLENASGLLARENAETRDMLTRFNLLRELRLGRMVGRAIAHEIGHFLSQSDAHTVTGLMRARHTVAALTGESHSPFTIEHREIAEADISR
jgi:hypothetical protein